MIDMKVDDLIAMLEPYRGKEVYIKCAYHNLDIKEVKVERYSHAGDYTHTRYMNVCKSYQIAGICSTYSTMINELNELN